MLTKLNFNYGETAILKSVKVFGDLAGKECVIVGPPLYHALKADYSIKLADGSRFECRDNCLMKLPHPDRVIDWSDMSDLFVPEMES